MNSIDQELEKIIDEREDTSEAKTLSEAAKFFEDLVRNGVVSKRGNRLAKEVLETTDQIVFNK